MDNEQLFSLCTIKRFYRALLRLTANHTLLPRLRINLLRWSGVSIGSKAFVNMDFLVIDDYNGGMVVIEEEVAIAPRVTLVAVSYPNESFISKQNDLTKQAPIIIKKGAWIGTGAVILPGVTVGIGAVVGAQSLVRKDVPDYSVVAGIPAKRIKAIIKEQPLLKEQ